MDAQNFDYLNKHRVWMSHLLLVGSVGLLLVLSVIGYNFFVDNRNQDAELFMGLFSLLGILIIFFALFCRLILKIIFLFKNPQMRE